MIDFTQFPSPCYIMEEELLRKNLSLIKSVADRAGVEIILAFKSFAMWRSFPIFREYIDHSTATGYFANNNMPKTCSKHISAAHYESKFIENSKSPLEQEPADESALPEQDESSEEYAE